MVDFVQHTQCILDQSAFIVASDLRENDASTSDNADWCDIRSADEGRGQVHETDTEVLSLTL